MERKIKAVEMISLGAVELESVVHYLLLSTFSPFELPLL